ncbi:hypothetical protein HAX54_020429, partial [Datura stramonium]|nr:hypothetical protein [Datura stramonium]
MLDCAKVERSRVEHLHWTCKMSNTGAVKEFQAHCSPYAFHLCAADVHLNMSSPRQQDKGKSPASTKGKGKGKSKETLVPPNYNDTL